MHVHVREVHDRLLSTYVRVRVHEVHDRLLSTFVPLRCHYGFTVCLIAISKAPP